MTDLSLRIPGKTFLAGEYLALLGGPSLVVATEPSFRLRISQRSGIQSNASQLFHRESPAGRFILKHLEFFEGFQFEWINPTGPGGLGASSAEFVGLHGFLQTQQGCDGEQEFNWHKMLDDYRETANATDTGWLPSGADLVAQVRGGISFLETRKGRAHSYSWTFPELGFFLVQTGTKVATHDHLRSLGHFDASILEKPTYQMCDSLSTGNEQLWIQGVAELARSLVKLDLVAPTTRELITKMERLPVLATKGCGALGADVISVYFKLDREFEVREGLDSFGLKIVASHREISEGLREN